MNENGTSKENSAQEIDFLSSVEFIHQQMDSDPHYPFNLQSGWLPSPESKSMQLFLEEVLDAPPTDYDPSIQALSEYISANPVIKYLLENACQENENIRDSKLPSAKGVPIPKINSIETLLSAFNAIMKKAPKFINDELVGLPFSAIVVGIDPTLSGSALFRLPMFNEKMSTVLTAWNQFLNTEASNTGFRVDGEGWLSPAAKKMYDFDIWEKDSTTLPYWSSWNSFFTRKFKDPSESRPITAPSSDEIVNCPNDGSLFRWDENVAKKDVFWFKDMKYSVSDILSSSVSAQQKVIQDHNLVESFSDGYIFQTYLNPYNFHRWWVPVNGTVLFDPFTIPGCFFSKLVIPDFAGATTASTPYLAEVNARGLIVFETEGYGRVCCIPLGMSEVSTVSFDTTMAQGKSVSKGEEMGTFQYGGSSFVIMFQKLPGKRLVFETQDGEKYKKRPVLPKGSANTGGNVTLIGSQIGIWKPELFSTLATQSWQTAGYVNPGDEYTVSYSGGTWTANPKNEGGTLYGAGGVSIPAPSGYPMPGENEGALIGRIGNNPPFLIGAQSTTIPTGQSGVLQLCINDDLSGEFGAGLEDNLGAVSVSITLQSQ